MESFEERVLNGNSMECGLVDYSIAKFDSVLTVFMKCNRYLILKRSGLLVHLLRRQYLFKDTRLALSD